MPDLYLLEDKWTKLRDIVNLLPYLSRCSSYLWSRSRTGCFVTKRDVNVDVYADCWAACRVANVTLCPTPSLSYHIIKLMLAKISLSVASVLKLEQTFLSQVCFVAQNVFNIWSEFSRTFNPGLKILFEILALERSSDKVCLLTPPLTQCMISLIT